MQVVTLLVDENNPTDLFRKIDKTFPLRGMCDVEFADDELSQIVLLMNLVKRTKGYTDQDLADKLGYTRGTIQKIRTCGLRPDYIKRGMLIDNLLEMLVEEN